MHYARTEMMLVMADHVDPVDQYLIDVEYWSTIVDCIDLIETSFTTISPEWPRARVQQETLASDIATC